MSLAQDLERFAGMELAGLRRRWRAVFGRAAPDALPRSILHRCLAYRVQADALGDLDRETARALDRLATDGEAIPRPDLRGRPPRSRTIPMRISSSGICGRRRSGRTSSRSSSRTTG